MPVPTVVNVLLYGADLADPVEGATMGGALLELYGDNFRLPTPPPANYTPDPGARAPRTVEVVFRDTVSGAEETATTVRVLASNKIRLHTPPTPIPVSIDPSDSTNNVIGEGPVDIVIRNLDDNEDPIPGEELVLSDAFTYRRPKLDATSPSDLERMVRAYIVAWMKHVIPNVLRTQHVDYDANPEDALNYVAVSSLPAIVLVGPDTPINRFYSRNNDEETTLSDGTPIVSRKPVTVDLNFDVVIMSDNPMEILALNQLAIQFIDRNPWIYIDRDGNDASAGRVRFEHAYQPGGDLASQTRPNNSSLEVVSGSVVIRGFPLADLASFQLEGITRAPVPLDSSTDSAISLDVGPTAE